MIYNVSKEEYQLLYKLKLQLDSFDKYNNKENFQSIADSFLADAIETKNRYNNLKSAEV